MSTYPYRHTYEASVGIAKDLGLDVVLPEANELFLDIDNEDDYKVFVEVSAILKDYIIAWHSAPSKSGLPKRHIKVQFSRDVNPIERIMLQALLGSDRKHEAHSIVAYINGHTNPTMFFEKPKVK